MRLGGKIAGVEAEAGELFVLFGCEIELEAPPAFTAQADVTAASIEQEFQFFRRQSGVADVENNLEVEPVHC